MRTLESTLHYIKDQASLEPSSATPLYRRIQRAISTAIKNGVIGDNEALPSERDLADSLTVSRVTIRNAIAALVREGLVVQQRGAGTFVSLRVEQPLSKLTGFTEDILSRGMTPSVQWLDRSCGYATPQESLALKLSPGAPVSRLNRIRLADNKAMCIEHATLPLEALPHPEKLETSLYMELEKKGLRPTRALQRLRAQIIQEEHAKLLQVPIGTACLYIERCSFLATGKEIELVRSYYRGDSYDFVAELKL
jgi:GntR family transcriptional regulator